MNKTRKLIGAFEVEREERCPALVALLYVVLLNAMVICRYFNKFSQLSNNYHQLFVKHFHVSGFDPLTYSVVSDWYTEYNIYRHPLLAFMMYVPYQINRLLMWATGMNFVQCIVALILIFCGFYSFLFLFRLLRRVVSLPLVDASLLSAFFMTFAYIMLSVCMPDHFVMSMFVLLFTLYLSGEKMQKNRPFTIMETVLLFVVTAGISLSNGAKTFLAAFFVNGKKVFRPSFLFLAILLPAALMWGLARWEWNYYEAPRYQQRQLAKQHRSEAFKAKVYKNYKDTTTCKDTLLIARQVDKIIKKQAMKKYLRDHQKPWNKHKGKPIANGEFTQWTDISTNRWSSMVENLFGESIQLHRKCLLGDTLRGRPVIVGYEGNFFYVVEGIIVLMFFAGVWIGRKSRFLWLAMSFFSVDMVIHLVLGFGLNEVYIMAAHWLFVIPIAIAFLLKASRGVQRKVLRALIGLLSAYLLVYNLYLFVEYLF